MNKSTCRHPLNNSFGAKPIFSHGIFLTHIAENKSKVLVLTYPVAFEGKLKQYIGRLRGTGTKYIIDICDPLVELLERQFKKRKKFYEKEFGVDTSA